MSYEPPTPPGGLSNDIVDILNEYSPGRLQQIAQYAEKLAEYKELEERLENTAEQEGAEELSEDLPNDVPAKATITIKDINDNRYYYWQWREGDKVKSQYKGPVNETGE